MPLTLPQPQTVSSLGTIASNLLQSNVPPLFLRFSTCREPSRNISHWPRWNNERISKYASDRKERRASQHVHGSCVAPAIQHNDLVLHEESDVASVCVHSRCSDVSSSIALLLTFPRPKRFPDALNRVRDSLGNVFNYNWLDKIAEWLLSIW